jgi:hypothetical protein
MFTDPSIIHGVCCPHETSNAIHLTPYQYLHSVTDGILALQHLV